MEYARGEIRAAPTDARDTAIFSTNGLHLYGSKYIRAANCFFGEIPQGIARRGNLSNSTPQGDGNAYALADSDEEAREFIAAYLDDAFTERKGGRVEPKHRHRQFDRTLSPRTLKRAVMGQDDWIMGLCALRRGGDAQTI
ncbi:hypothetical protein [uncultured Selenomonas sp.]|uniref:hypothetical protein n=1 Tax=uncultured Selenomonas sp. TaxID=159275 RepID=UPI0028E938B5|nr:hypothetical protein [uncultured Selenomonas sp.]